MLLSVVALGCGLLLALPDVQGESIELTVIVDKMAQDKWASDLGVQSYQVQSAMRKFLDGLWADVNVYFESLKINNNPVDVRIKQLKFLQTTPVTDPDIATNMDKFRAWLETQNMGQSDHWMLLTGTDIEDKRMGWMRKKVAGAATLYRMCSQYSHSIVELWNDRSGRLASTIAHELGHSLGAQHDGQEKSSGASCQAQKNIMSPSPPHAPADPSATFRWSWCSQSAITKNFNRIKSESWGKCLTQTTAPKAPTTFLGQIYEEADMCKMTYKGSTLDTSDWAKKLNPCWEVMCVMPPRPGQPSTSKSMKNVYATNGFRCPSGSCKAGRCSSSG